MTPTPAPAPGSAQRTTFTPRPRPPATFPEAGGFCFRGRAVDPSPPRNSRRHEGEANPNGSGRWLRLGAALAGCANRRELATLSPTIVIPTWGASAMKLSILRTLRVVIGSVGVLAFAGAVSAQTAGGDSGGTRGGPDLSFTVSVGGESSLEADVEGGGALDVFRMRFGVTGKAGLTRDLDLAVSVGYGLDLYDFSGTTRLGGVDPWADIHTLSVGALLSLDLNNDWTVFGGPVVQFAREDNVGLDDSFIGGGVVGATYQVSSALTVGGGIGVVSQIEDDARFFPVIVLEWEISDTLRLTSQTSGAAGRSGLELVYDLGNDWEAAIGASSDFRRFRLNDEGIAPEGVGEETRLPIRARLSYRAGDHFIIDLYTGIAMSSELTLEDTDGMLLGQEDVDPAGLLGVTFTITF